MDDTPRDLAGRWIVVTGANTGIGRVTAERLAARGASVVLACRTEARTQPVLAAIRAAGGEATFAALDLGDLASVRACAEGLVAQGRPLDILVNNAGLAGSRGVTRDGFEVAFGTNHLGHYLLTVLLLPRLREAPAARIVTVSSRAHTGARGFDWDALQKPTRSVGGLREYGVSKLANVLFTRELSRRLGASGPHAYALHPGVVASDVWRRVPQPFRWLMTRGMLTVEQGAQTTLYCAASPDVAGDTGRYYDACRERPASPLADDPELARALWDHSARWTHADIP